VLSIFGGLPGTGKSTLASALAHRCKAVYLRIDTIEQSLRHAGMAEIGPTGYEIAYAVALDNLCQGNRVVADSVNPIEITREAWRSTAGSADVSFVEIEVVCSNREEHRARVESRIADIPGMKLPTWEEVVDREYARWETGPVVIDTAGQSPQESIEILFEALSLG